MVNKLLCDQTNGSNKCWRSGLVGTILRENETLGYRQRQKGIPEKTLMTCFFDQCRYFRKEMLKVVKENKIVSEAVINLLEEEKDGGDDSVDFFGGLFKNFRKPNQSGALSVLTDVILLQRIDAEIEDYENNMDSIPTITKINGERVMAMSISRLLCYYP